MKEKLSFSGIPKKCFQSSLRAGFSYFGAISVHNIFITEAGLRNRAVLIKCGASDKVPGVCEW